jgi:integrase
LEATVNTVAVARHHGIEAFVNMSQMTVTQMSITETTESPQHMLHWLAEQTLSWSGLPVVTVRPTVFLEGFFLLLAAQPMSQPDAWRMIRRRAAAAGIAEAIGCHTFRATGITAYLANGGAHDHAQEMAAHESPRTTKLYDRTKERLTQDEVERIRL